MNILLALVIIVALFFGFQYFMVLKMKLKKGKPAPALSGTYGKALKGGKSVLFYFYSPNCGACRTMTPLVGKYTKNNPRCFKVDISKDMNTARAFGVMGTPSTVVVEGGKIKEFVVGPKPEAEFTRMLEATKA
ncbi:MAG: thiol reductase thioredoxin [Spirochaetaceae bacterium 4572_59]|nr:MAG: thiol reductase thioredoxin [Spirochaetaceae bacterium 4572_59]